MEYYMDSWIEKKLIDALIKDHPEFKKKLKIVYLWIGIAISLIVGFYIWGLWHQFNLNGFLAGTIAGFLAALLPAIWAQSTYFKAKKIVVGHTIRERERC